MARAAKLTVVPPSTPTLAPAPVRPPINTLRKYGAIEFKGQKEDDASIAEYWLQSTDMIPRQLQYSP